MKMISRALLMAGAGMLACSVPLMAPATAQDNTAVERPMADAAYWDASLPVEQRVADLMARMTIEEKMAQMISTWTNKAEVQDERRDSDEAASRR